MPFENFVWLLWSIKESVFKYQKRNFHHLVFSPGKIIIQRIDFPANGTVTRFGNIQYERNSFCEEEFYSCEVYSGSEIFYSSSKIHCELIYTIVHHEEKPEHTWWGIKFIDNSDNENQSKEVRSFVLNKLRSIFPNDNLQIRKNATGYPVLLKGTEEMAIPVSFAHHDHFVAYSFLLPNGS